MTVELSYNNEKGGIELLFSKALSKAAATHLRELGFKQGFKSEVKWYAPQHPAFINYAQELQSALLKGTITQNNLKDLPIKASFTPSLKNIDDKKFSYVSILYKDLTASDDAPREQRERQDDYLIFDSYKTIAAAIASRFGIEKYKAAFIGVKVFPRNYKRKARVLLKQGKVITTKEIDQVSLKEGATQSQVSAKEGVAKSQVLAKEGATNSDQHLLNKEIAAFITEKDKENYRYTSADKNFLLQYTGSGGLIKEGAKGKGILYEYFTPDVIVQKMWGLAIKYGYKDGAVLEPACGIGNFIKYAPAGAKVTGYEINPISKRIAEIVYPHAQIYQAPFESLFFTGLVHLKDDFKKTAYRLVIGNPPYGSFSGKWAGMGEKKWTGANEYDQYFITRGLDVLAKNGLLIFIIPSSFLQNGAKYNAIKEKINAKAQLLDAYRLPQRAFKTTDIGTDIVVFKKL